MSVCTHPGEDDCGNVEYYFGFRFLNFQVEIMSIKIVLKNCQR